VHLGALRPQRDMTYVADTVEGFICAATTQGIEGETINLGTGKSFSIGDLAHRILELMKCNKPILHDAARDRPEKSEVMNLISDNRKAARLMQWRPTTSLDDGLRRTIDFVAANLGFYAPDRYTV
jgi:nucleoside-diphosphate-sugar epimerase